MPVQALARPVKNPVDRLPRSRGRGEQRRAGEVACAACAENEVAVTRQNANVITVLMERMLPASLADAWCPPCRAEFPLLAAASAQFGRKVAFLGADTNDSPGDARTFLAQHPVSYPSYSVASTDLSSLAVLEGFPTTIFINPAGKVVFVHTGQYESQTALDNDIDRYALGESS